MDNLYRQAITQGQLVFHKQYCLYNDHLVTAFDAGAIRLIQIEWKQNAVDPLVSVVFEDGSVFRWSSNWVTPYHYQFGIAASLIVTTDIFLQSWENGLLCLDSRTGKKIWRTKSKRGVTNVFVNENSILCHRHEHALQLIDIHTGEVIKEKRPVKAWGFQAIDHSHVVCQVSARRWEVIGTEALDVKAAFSHREFTNGHTDYVVNRVRLEDKQLIIRGFKNVWDDSVLPPKRLPNLEFEHHLDFDG